MTAILLTIAAVPNVAADGGINILGVAPGASRTTVDAVMASVGKKLVSFPEIDKTVLVYCPGGPMVGTVSAPRVVYGPDQRVTEVWAEELSVDGVELGRTSGPQSVLDKLGTPTNQFDLHKGNKDYRLFVYQSKGLLVQALKGVSDTKPFFYLDCFKLSSDLDSLSTDYGRKG